MYREQVMLALKHVRSLVEHGADRTALETALRAAEAAAERGSSDDAGLGVTLNGGLQFSISARTIALDHALLVSERLAGNDYAYPDVPSPKMLTAARQGISRAAGALLRDGTPYASGALLAGGRFLTAAHVADNLTEAVRERRVTVRLTRVLGYDERGYAVLCREFEVLDRIAIPGSADEADGVALLRLGGDPNPEFGSASIGPASAAGERCFLIHHPHFDRQITVRANASAPGLRVVPGRVARPFVEKLLSWGTLESCDERLALHCCMSERGSSGAPLCDELGRVFAVHLGAQTLGGEGRRAAPLSALPWGAL